MVGRYLAALLLASTVACGGATPSSPDTTVLTSATPHGGDVAAPRRARSCAADDVKKTVEALDRDEKAQRKALGDAQLQPPDWADLRERYRSLLRDCPDAPGLASTYLAFGNLLLDLNAAEEAQPVFRSLVCHDRFPKPVPTVAQHLAQDRPVEAWRARNEIEALPAFVDPYPATCKPLEDAAPGFVAGGWLFIGEHHFVELGEGGPYEPNRAIVAYRHAAESAAVAGNVQVRSVVLYKLGWANYRTGRYAAAAKALGTLLDEIERTPLEDAHTQQSLLTEATTYLAACLTYVAFDGPPESSASTPVEDATERVSSTEELSKLLEVALTRLQDPKIVKPGAAYAPDVYRALANDLEDQTLYDLANRTRALYLTAFPIHRDVPRIHADMVHAFLASSSVLKASSPAKSAEAARRARDQLAQLRKLVKAGPWLTANGSDVDAVREARAQIERAEADVQKRPPKKLSPDTATQILIR